MQKNGSAPASLNRYAEDLRLLPLQPRSQQAYLACVRQLGEHFGRAPEQVRPEELRQYFVHLKTERRFSRSSSTQAICASKLFWEKSLRRFWPAEAAFHPSAPRWRRSERAIRSGPGGNVGQRGGRT